MAARAQAMAGTCVAPGISISDAQNHGDLAGRCLLLVPLFAAPPAAGAPHLLILLAVACWLARPSQQPGHDPAHKLCHKKPVCRGDAHGNLCV